MSVKKRRTVVESMIIESYEITGFETAVKAIGLSYAGAFDNLEHAKRTAKMLLRHGLHDGEANFLTGVNVSMMVNASLKWWQQAERYHWFQIVMSQSVMHQIAHRKPEQIEYAEGTPRATIEAFEETIKSYRNEETSLLGLIYSVPSGFKEKARVSTNYLQLMTIVKQRERHTLPEWREFCEIVREMPYMDELLKSV